MEDEKARPAPGAPQEVHPPKYANGGTVSWKAKDPLGCEIALYLETEAHILAGHPEMKAYLDAVKLTIEDPVLIQRDGIDGTTCFYYRMANRNFHKHRDIYVSVVVQRGETSGRVKTAHLVKTLRSNPGETLWIKSSK